MYFCQNITKFLQTFREIEIVSRQPKTYDSEGHIVNDPSINNYAKSQLYRLEIDFVIDEIRNGRKLVKDFYRSLDLMSVSDAKALLYIDNDDVGESRLNLNYDDHDFINLLREYLQGYEDPISRYNELIYLKVKDNLPEDYLEWFKDDLRCSVFLASLVERQFAGCAYKGRLEFISAVSDFIRYDIYLFNNKYTIPKYKSKRYVSLLDEKVRSILLIKSTYLINRVTDEEVKWIDSSNADQIEQIYNYLNKEKVEGENSNGRLDQESRKEKPNYIALKNIFFPQNTQEKYELILASLDALSNIDYPAFKTTKENSFSERGYVLYSLRNAIKAKKSYSAQNTNNDNTSVKIYKKNYAKLHKLASDDGLTINKFINKLIEEQPPRTC